MKKAAILICMLMVMLLMTAVAFASGDGTKAETDGRSAAGVLELNSSSVSYGGYTYSITPVMAPFNQYFFVRTDNPDPSSFRFKDKSTVYEGKPYILCEEKSGSPKLYADVNYEEETTGRVGGGYIFCGGGTDGGDVTLETVSDPNASYLSWKDTGVKVTLPVLRNSCDYLIDTYADKSSFFDNMDAVQSALSSISVYSGSFRRGDLVKVCDYWLCGLSPYIDQSFYIYSPYERNDNQDLFASAVYPYKLDSIAFPSMMGSVAETLSSEASIEWSSSSHDVINVTYGGVTKGYGGEGNYKGQGISEDKISRRFDFSSGGIDMTFSGVRGLLVEYSFAQMEDDLPRGDALTWKQIWNTVGDGAWVRVSPKGKNSGYTAFSYFYQEGDGDSFDADEFEVGTSLYWEGDLEYAKDAWVDGRYVDEYRKLVPDAEFTDHPESSIILKDVMIPQIPCGFTWEKNETTGKTEAVYYVDGDITEEKRTVVFKYKDGVWAVWSLVFNSGCASYDAIKQMAERGKIDQKYLDAVQLTESEVEAIDVDRNKGTYPDKGYIFDGTAMPGTLYDESAAHSWSYGKVEQEAGCETDGRKVYTCLICGETRTETIEATGHKWGSVSYKWAKDNSKARAERICENNSAHVESETVDTTAVTLIEVGCEKLGRIRYTAVFSNPAFTSVSRNQDITPLGHKWGKCEIVTVPTAEMEGERVYTCERCGVTRTESIPVVIDEITPTLETADKAPLDKTIPKVVRSKIKTTGSVSKKWLKITFPKSKAADNYLIQYRRAGATEPENCWTGGKGYYTVKGLKKNGLYQFRIQGFARQEDLSWHHGAWSDVVYRYMKTVTLKKVTPGKRKLTVTWSKDTNSTGYHVLYSTKKSMAGAKTKKVNGKAKTKCTIKKLKKGKKYYVKVMPVKVKSGKTYTGILSGVKGARIK